MTNANLPYQRELVEVNIAARRELGLKLDEAEYRSQNREAEAAITTAIDQTIREIEALQPNTYQPSPSQGRRSSASGRRPKPKRRKSKRDRAS